MAAVDYDNDLLLVTCASGKICSYLLPLLSQQWKRLRLVCNTEKSKARLKATYPSAEVLALDLLDRASCQEAMKGVTACFHIGPPMHHYETTIGINMIDAAIAESGSPRRRDGRAGKWKFADLKDGASSSNTTTTAAAKETRDPSNGGGSGGGRKNFQHFVFSSVLNSQLRKLLNHDCKRYVEEYLIESGLGYTILQPTHFFQNMHPGPVALQQQATSTSSTTTPSPLTFPCAWNPDVPYSFLDLQDFAHATLTVLSQRSRHYGAQYALCSTSALTYRQLVGEVGAALGREVRVDQMSLDEARRAFVGRVAGEDRSADCATLDGVERLLLYYDRHGLVGCPTVLGFLLGREPVGAKGWVERVLREGR